MAVVGNQLWNPEPSWRRYDNKEVIMDGHLKTDDRKAHNATSTIISSDMAEIIKLKFKFYGTKLRFTGWRDRNRPYTFYVKIDDVVYTGNANGSNQVRTLLFEKLGLEEAIHSVEIYYDNTAPVSGWVGLDVDAIDIDDNGYIVEEYGTILYKASPSWKRYDDNAKELLYVGNWEVYTSPVHYSGSCHFCTSTNNKEGLYFNFYGSKIRIIDVIWYDRFNNGVDIIIDGVKEHFTTHRTTVYGTLRCNVIVYEKTGLELKEHSVQIIPRTPTNSPSYFSIDAIDIDDIGELYKYRIIPPKNPNAVQLTSIYYEDDDIVRKDYIGDIENSSLGQVEVIESINKVSNNEVRAINKKSNYEPNFILK